MPTTDTYLSCALSSSCITAFSHQKYYHNHACADLLKELIWSCRNFERDPCVCMKSLHEVEAKITDLNETETSPLAKKCPQLIEGSEQFPVRRLRCRDASATVVTHRGRLPGIAAFSGSRHGNVLRRNNHKNTLVNH